MSNLVSSAPYGEADNSSTKETQHEDLANDADRDYVDGSIGDPAVAEAYDAREPLATMRKETSIRLRSYQSEMLDESLQRNVIVAMDTGSGKTHIAIARIQHELEAAGNPSNLIWFMCPSVALSLQQYAVLSDALPGYLIKTLMGMDGVDKWTNQALWDGVLKDVSVVVGTPKVLEDALTHGFVQLSNISLLVFDEAHRCIKDTPMNTIMQNFYHPTKASGKRVPSVLGLTASPVISEKSGTLETLEANLDAVAITPKQYRAELETYVHPPELSRITYASSIDYLLQDDAPLCHTLASCVNLYDITADPWFKYLSQFGDEKSCSKREKLRLNPDTYCYRQLKALFRRSNTLCEQLGTASAEWYLRECMQRYSGTAQGDTTISMDVRHEEKTHLRAIFDDILHSSEVSIRLDVAHAISDKARALVELLTQHISSSVRGILFVEQRVIVTVLAHILQAHPQVKSHYTIGTFVGTSTFASRETEVADLTDLKQQQQDLIDFRNGTKNLMISTNVLEEGIDVSACNLVVCFDPPKNLISFVQRRGRARQKKSKYVVFLSERDLQFDPSKWQRLEADMRQAYLDETRGTGSTEAADVAEEDTNDRVHRIPNTGALLTLSNSKAHLYHFCAVSSLHASRYVDLRPEFSTRKNGGPRPWLAHVNLPSFVHSSLRTASSSRGYRTEATAVKDAAFEAYVGLYKAGLVNDNLLPWHEAEPEFGRAEQASVVQVAERQNSWRHLFRRLAYEETFDHAAEDRPNSGVLEPTTAIPFFTPKHRYLVGESFQEARNQPLKPVQWHGCTLKISLKDAIMISVRMWLPVALPYVPAFNLYWDETTTYVAHIQSLEHEIVPGESWNLDEIRRFTYTMLKSVNRQHMRASHELDFPLLFSPEDANTGTSTTPYPGAATMAPLECQAFSGMQHASSSNAPMDGCQHASVLLGIALDTDTCGLIRVNGQGDRPYLFNGFARDSRTDRPDTVAATRFPKRRDFLHREQEDNDKSAAYTAVQTFSINDCTVDNLPTKYAILAVFVPSIMHRLDVALLSQDLQITALAEVKISNLSLITEAISAPVAREDADYNRLEFLGDCILKFCATIHVMAEHLNWPEGYLSREKGYLISNNRFSKAALELGLDRYILDKSFTGNKWRPTHIQEMLRQEDSGTRPMSSKVLADVVEALVGAAFIDGGLKKARKCIRKLLPDQEWYPLPKAIDWMLQDHGLGGAKGTNLVLLERLIGHKFDHSGLLIEAITHASFPYSGTGLSYERLEFLGDAVLDLLVVPKIFAHSAGKKHWEMHRIRGTVVCGPFLGYCCMKYGGEEEKFDVVEDKSINGGRLRLQGSSRNVHLHDFLRASDQLQEEKRRSLERFEKFHQIVEGALEHGIEYPWPELIAMAPQKSLSDMIEAVLGALFLDTRGNLAVCGAFIERLGILKHMRRILNENIETAMPREQLGSLVNDRVEYTVTQTEASDGNRSFACVVTVGGTDIGRAFGCGSKDEAVARAAREGVRVVGAKAGARDGNRERKLET